jgi:hypothetical protein
MQDQNNILIPLLRGLKENNVEIQKGWLGKAGVTSEAYRQRKRK